jgi:hypothetical protein
MRRLYLLFALVVTASAKWLPVDQPDPTHIFSREMLAAHNQIRARVDGHIERRKVQGEIKNGLLNARVSQCAARHIGNRTYQRHGLHFFPWKGAGSGMLWKESSVMDERIRLVIRLRWRKYGFAVPGVWNLAQDGLQDRRPL